MSVKQQQRRAARPLTQRIGARRRPRAPRGPSSDRQESGWSDAAVLDQQQTLLLAVLHRARGEVVSYDELMRIIRRHPNKRHFISRLEDAKVRKIDRKGKYLIFRLDNGAALVVHLGTSG